MRLATDVIDIPLDLSVEDVMTFMGSGHGYEWEVLVTSHYFMSHGQPLMGRSGDLAIIDRRLLVWGDEVLVSRIRHMLRLLCRTRGRGP